MFWEVVGSGVKYRYVNCSKGAKIGKNTTVILWSDVEVENIFFLCVFRDHLKVNPAVVNAFSRHRRAHSRGLVYIGPLNPA